jgi:transposase-like protein
MMRDDDVLMMPAARRIEVLSARDQRRRWSAEAKAQIVAEGYEASVGEVADRYSMSKAQVFTWRRDARARPSLRWWSRLRSRFRRSGGRRDRD